jgi:hypothetical protein
MRVLEVYGLIFLIGLSLVSVMGTPSTYLAGLGIYFTNNISLGDTINANITPDTLIHHELSYTAYIDEVTRRTNLDIFGGTNTLALNDTLNPTTNISLTNGVSKIGIAITSGSDFTGSIKITGTYRNRTTWELITGSETIAVTLLTTEVEEGLQYNNLYLTSLWWAGDFNITTTDVTLSSVDLIQIGFDQLGEHQNFTVEELDVTFRKSNVNGGLNVSFFSVLKNNGYYNLTREFFLTSEEGEGIVNGMFRMKRNGGIKKFNGTNEGFFVFVDPKPDVQDYIEDLTVRVTTTVWETIGNRETMASNP